MKILGISDSHDSGAAIIENGGIKAAINEERLIRKKLCWGFPLNSIKKVLELSKLEPKDVDLIALASKSLPITKRAHNYEEGILFEESNRVAGSLLGKSFGWAFARPEWIRIHKAVGFPKYIRRKATFGSLLKEMGFECPIKYYEHHTCHAASAYYTGGKQKALVLTTDAAGDGLCATVNEGVNGGMVRLKEVDSFNSIAKYYSYVTVICGFKEGRHEGKITGLAAYGKPIYMDKFREMIEFKDGGFVNKCHLRHKAAKDHIMSFAKNFKKEDLASTIQLFAEEEMKKFAQFWIEKTGITDLVLAGGIFANIRINQEILENTDATSVFIHPHMGDGGLAVGAALQAYSIEKGLKPFKIEDVYFGNEPGKIESANNVDLLNRNYRLMETNDVVGEVASMLKNGLAVGLCQGRMEYGPRALGNRTILANPKNKNINKKLNKRLKRTEFMPFAPVFEDKTCSEYFEGYSDASYPAKFMTIGFYAGDALTKLAPAIVHIDNTLRPQVISRETNKTYFDIVKSFREATKIPCLINTSFNVHEEPIICTADDAFRSLADDCVDALVLNDELYIKK